MTALKPESIRESRGRSPDNLLWTTVGFKSEGVSLTFGFNRSQWVSALYLKTEPRKSALVGYGAASTKQVKLDFPSANHTLTSANNGISKVEVPIAPV